MPNYVDLPIEFQALAGKVQWVQRVNENEYKSSCPNCGIDPAKHSDTNPSDRFVMWIQSRNTGKPFGMCMRGHCGWKWTPDKHDVHWTPEERAEFEHKRRELNEREEERIRKYASDVVMKHRAYAQYSEVLKTSNYGKKYLYERGFNSDEWNSFFEFGIIEAMRIKGRMSTYFSPAISMPIVSLGEVVENVKVRVTEAKCPEDRYRNLYKAGNQSVYFPLHDMKVSNVMAVFEGEFKSCQVAMRGNLPEHVGIVGTQGMGIGARMIYMLESAEVVYLCLDPDSLTPNKNGDTPMGSAIRKFGVNRTRIIPCKGKIDDMLLKGFNLRNAFNMAIKPSQLGVKL